jgi:hypothetical protein
MIGSDVALADEPLLTDEQMLAGIALELGESENVVNATADVSAGPSETIDLNWTEGVSNLQDNDFVLSFTSEDAQSLLQQSLLGQSFNRESGELARARMHNALTADISAPDGVEGTVGVNMAAGAFNLQKNTAAIAIIPGNQLASSFAGIGQEAANNLSLHHDATNDVTAIITLDNVSGNFGINLAAGVGNVQLNTVTTALSF